MQIYTFKYTKANGVASDRVLVPFVEPSKHFGGMDISELSTEEQALYISEVERVRHDYYENLNKLTEKYDLVRRYRQFDPDKMSNVVTEDV